MTPFKGMQLGPSSHSHHAANGSASAEAGDPHHKMATFIVALS